MSDSADDIIQRMHAVRREVGNDVKGIVDTAKTLSDWRYHVRRHPWLCVAAAAGLGFLLVPRRKKVPSHDAKELADLLKKYNVGVTAPPAGGLARSLIAMAVPLAMKAATSFAQQKFAAAAQHPRDDRETYEDYNIPR